jgi:ribosome-associated heat shock protein Hsp15
VSSRSSESTRSTALPRAGARSSPRDGIPARRACEALRIESVRIDQWLFSVRATKTRADAAAACRGGHVKVNGKTAKPATPVRVGDHVEAKVPRGDRVLEVRKLISKRVGASLAVECYDDHSPPPPERDPAPVFGRRDRGAGRPTKRDRRQLDKLRGRRT